MKKTFSIILIMTLCLALCLCGCGKKPDPVPDTGEQENTSPVPETQEPGKEPDIYEDSPLHWEDLVGTWYLKTMINTDLEERIREDAAENNIDARITFTDTDGINWMWSTRLGGVIESYEDMPHEILKETATDEEECLEWCVAADGPENTSYRMGLKDKDTLVVVETIDLDGDTFGYIEVFTKDGPIEFHTPEYDYGYLTGRWYMHSVEVEGSLENVTDSGLDCSICFNEDMTADWYYGNLYYDADNEEYYGCPVTILDTPVLNWIEEGYEARQNWSVTVDIPWNEVSEEEYYCFGLTDDYTLTMYHEIVSDGGSYNVGVVAEFKWNSPYEEEEGEPFTPAMIRDMIDNAGEDEELIFIADPSEELIAECEDCDWMLSDNSDYYSWENPAELIIAPTHRSVEVNISEADINLGPNGFIQSYELKEGGSVYWNYLPVGCVGRVVADIPENREDATLLLLLSFDDEDSGEGPIAIPLFAFGSESDPYLIFE